MKLPRLLVAALAGVLALSSLAAHAQARGRGRYERGERRGLISGKTTQERQREERERQREEQRRKAEELREKREEERRAKAEKRKAEAQARALAAQKAQAARSQRPAARKPARKGGDAAKDDEAAEKEAAQLLEEAEKQFAENQLVPGVQTLREVLADYGTTAAARAAQARLDQLMALESLGPAILLGEGHAFFDESRYHRALTKYAEVLERFPESDQAAEARARIQQIREEDLLSQTVYTPEELEDARLWLLVGNIHLENDRAAQAKSAYRKVLEHYPGCRYAEEAEEQLEAMSKAQAEAPGGEQGA
ncbi:MAG: hypothetical protein ACLF0G_11480 [Candidatus Brocadiia bacterium]